MEVPIRNLLLITGAGSDVEAVAEASASREASAIRIIPQFDAKALKRAAAELERSG